MDLNILHVDMDAFYASVEENDDKNLRGKPVIVGGLKSHGVVTTANYEARKFGVHSAMPAFKARELCPHGYYIRPRMERYRQVSREIFEILNRYTDRVEKISVDEAYLDISGTDTSGEELAADLKKSVKEELGLTLSVGLSYNKFLAKLASDWDKPDGFFKISPDMLPEILLPLSIDEVHGIGRISSCKLKDIGVFTVKDLLNLDLDFLVNMFGKQGHEIYLRIRGIDNREVEVNRERKSIGIERTFNEETRDLKVLEAYLLDFSKALALELEKKSFHTKTITIKIKDSDFKTQTRSRTLTNYIYREDDIIEVARELFKDLRINKKIRLLGLTAANLVDSNLEQLSLFD